MENGRLENHSLLQRMVLEKMVQENMQLLEARQELTQKVQELEEMRSYAVEMSLLHALRFAEEAEADVRGETPATAGAAGAADAHFNEASQTRSVPHPLRDTSAATVEAQNRRIVMLEEEKSKLTAKVKHLEKVIEDLHEMISMRLDDLTLKQTTMASNQLALYREMFGDKALQHLASLPGEVDEQAGDSGFAQDDGADVGRGEGLDSEGKDDEVNGQAPHAADEEVRYKGVEEEEEEEKMEEEEDRGDTINSSWSQEQTLQHLHFQRRQYQQHHQESLSESKTSRLSASSMTDLGLVAESVTTNQGAAAAAAAAGTDPGDGELDGGDESDVVEDIGVLVHLHSTVDDDEDKDLDKSKESTSSNEEDELSNAF